jgi:hypothetical protein
MLSAYCVYFFRPASHLSKFFDYIAAPRRFQLFPLPIDNYIIAPHPGLFGAARIADAVPGIPLSGAGIVGHGNLRDLENGAEGELVY